MSFRFALLVAAVALPIVAPAQQYPSKTIRLIVPTAPGGGADFLGRVLAQGLNPALGQPVVVDNRGGGGTSIGTALAAKSPPDGHTLLIQHNSLAFNATFYRKLPYDTLKDLAPISLLASQPYIVAVHPSLPVRSMKELVSLARARPGQLAYASGGGGSGPYMGAELLKHAAKIDVLHVPYKGAGPAFADLMGGQVQMMVVTMSVGLPHARSGKVRALAVTSGKRVANASDLPTVGESGVPGYEYTTWYGLLAPAGTPSAVIARLNAETAKVIGAREVHDKLTADGLTPLRSSPEEFAAFISRDIARWAAIVRASGQYAD